ncbi:MAG: hypothetical protein ACRD3O_23495, partial [Terriglobia bacterium]
APARSPGDAQPAEGSLRQRPGVTPSPSGISAGPAPQTQPAASSSSPANGSALDLVETAAALLEAGLSLLRSFQTNAPAATASSPVEPFKQKLSTLIHSDPQSQKQVLSIPLPENLTIDRVARAVKDLFESRKPV